MDTSNVVLLIGILVVLGIVGATVVMTISGSVSVGKRVREGLIGRVRQLPLYRMLSKRKIDLDDYLESAGADEVKAQIDACQECEHQQECEEALESKDNQDTDYSFCPNEPEIEKLKQKTAAKSGAR